MTNGSSNVGKTSNVPASKDALLKSYRKRLKEDTNSMTSNFMEIIKLCKVEEETQVMRATQCEEDEFEMQVRAANMVSANISDALCKMRSFCNWFLTALCN